MQSSDVNDICTVNVDTPMIRLCSCYRERFQGIGALSNPVLRSLLKTTACFVAPVASETAFRNEDLNLLPRYDKLFKAIPLVILGRVPCKDGV